MRNHIYNVYHLRDPQRGTWGLSGSYHSDDQTPPTVLSDYFGHLSGIDKDPKKMEALQGSPYFRIASRQELADGHHTDLLPVSTKAKGAPASKGDADFDLYHPIMGPVPVPLSIKQGRYYLNNEALTHQEVGALNDHLKSGQATVRYRKTPESAVQKMEQAFATLMKADPHLNEAVLHLNEAVKNGHIKPEMAKKLIDELYTDPMVPSIGNRRAHEDFLTRPKEGVHIFMDGNDFGSINKMHSHDHGDQAIKAFGQAMRDTMDETVGRGSGKLFRSGGDEFVAHVPTQEHAAAFARGLRNRLDAIPPIGGTHKLSVSMGMGADPASAEAAAGMAKKTKKAHGYPLGQAQTHVHSLIPGSEGAVPVSFEIPRFLPPPSAAPAAVADAVPAAETQVGGKK